jgi:hypothetical protein
MIYSHLYGSDGSLLSDIGMSIGDLESTATALETASLVSDYGDLDSIADTVADELYDAVSLKSDLSLTKEEVRQEVRETVAEELKESGTIERLLNTILERLDSKHLDARPVPAPQPPVTQPRQMSYSMPIAATDPARLDSIRGMLFR